MGAAELSLQGKGGLPPGSQLGRYEILAKLAAGGMAVVYVARAQGVAGFARLVAIKVLHANLAHEEQFISMFLDEARLAARIRHPNVVPTTDISDSLKTGYFLVMDYIEGDHLGQLLVGAHRLEERLPLPVALRIIVDALSGLGAAHDLCDEDGKHLKLVHRDVSPHNIMIGVDGVARLTDFGVAKAEDRLTHTRDGQVKGKLAYMAPEQASTGQADARADLFAMGVILWETLVGRRLFRADSTAATLNKLLHDDVPLVSSIEPSLKPLDEVVAKALERDVDKRYQDVDEFITALEAVAPQMGGLASLRSVGKAVKKFASDKLQKEKALIKEAVRHVKKKTGEPVTGELDVGELSEPSGLALDDISVSQGSMSVSKLSGVFSQPTQPGIQPVAVDDTGAPLYDVAAVSAQGRHGRLLRLLVLGAGVIALVALGVYLLLDPQGVERVRIVEMAPAAPAPVPAPPPPTVAAPSVTAPAAQPADAAKSAPEVEPVAKPTPAVKAPPRAKPKPKAKPRPRPAVKAKARAPKKPPAARPAPKPAVVAPAPPPPKRKAEPDLFKNPYAR